MTLVSLNKIDRLLFVEIESLYELHRLDVYRIYHHLFLECMYLYEYERQKLPR